LSNSVTDKQTNKQTDTANNITSLAELTANQCRYRVLQCPQVWEAGGGELATAANEWKIFCVRRPIPTVEICPIRKSEPKVWAARNLAEDTRSNLKRGKSRRKSS